MRVLESAMERALDGLPQQVLSALATVESPADKAGPTDVDQDRTELTAFIDKRLPDALPARRLRTYPKNALDPSESSALNHGCKSCELGAKGRARRTAATGYSATV